MDGRGLAIALEQERHRCLMMRVAATRLRHRRLMLAAGTVGILAVLALAALIPLAGA